MKVEFLYRVEDFSPPLESGKLGGYGFNIHLDREFARRTKQKTIEDAIQERLNEIEKDNIVKRLFPRSLITPPYHFVDNSLLVSSFHVPGDDCELGLSHVEVESLDKEDKHSNSVKLHSHNVDNYQQAYALFSLFTNWIDYAESWLRPK